MSDIAIRVENLGKRYRIGERPEKYPTLRDQLANAACKPFHLLRSGWGASSATQADNHVWALRDVSFEVKPGEVVGVIGRNGAGKSTLLKILSRITEPTEGEADIHGRVGSLLEVGTGFHPELTGRENIYLNGAILGMRRAEIDRRLDEIIAFAEVSKFVDTPIKRYSSGMYLRLAFAVAAHLDPEILLVDEVLAVGDVDFQKKCLGRMHQIANRGRTVLFISHNMAAIRRICDKAIMLQDGRVDFEGPSDEALEHYISRKSGLGYTECLADAARRGRGDVRITRVSMCCNGREAQQYRCGAPFSLRLRYESRQRIDTLGLNVQVRFLDDFGGTILTLWNRMVEQHVREYRQSGWMEFSLDSLPLRPGVYPLTIWVRSSRGVEDWIEDAVAIEVVGDDVFGSGRLPPRDAGPIMVPYQFDVLSEGAVPKALATESSRGNGKFRPAASERCLERLP